MNSETPGALSEALRLLELPSGVPAARTRRFPADVGVLIRLLAGDEARLEQASYQHPEAVAVLLDAAEFYVLQVCFTPGIDSYRVLGVNRDVPIERIREHYRLLVRWLHPDRNSDAWQNVYLDRVNQAWRDLRHAPERAQYDQRVPETATAEAAVPASGVPAFARVPAVAAPGLRSVSARTMRRLPARVLAVLGAAAALALGWFYLDQPERVALPELRPADELASAVATDRFRRAPLPPTLVPTQVGPIEPIPVVVPEAIEQVGDVSPASALGLGDRTLLVVSAASATAVRTKSATEAVPGSARSAWHHRVDSDEVSSPPPPVGRTEQAAVVAEMTPSSAPPATTARDDDTDPTPPPVIAASSALPTAPPPDRVDPLAVRALLDQFQRAYGAGDLIRLMALFTRDARNRPKDQGLLADDYRALFESSRARSLSLSHVNWWQESGGLAVVASFEAAVTPVESRREHLSAGDIFFELRREGDAVRIASVRHQEHGR